MISRMKLALWILPCCTLALFLSSCGNNSGSSGGPDIVGPFDADGNYIEAWADNPTKWKKNSGTRPAQPSQGDYLPPVASANDMPPANAVPLAPKSSKPAPPISKTDISERPVVTNTRPKPSTTVKKPSTTVAKSTKPKTTTKKSTTVAKAKPKPKPKATRYTVKSGDTLSAIAAKTGSSVSAIRSANGISGSLIRPGQSLAIPKK